MTNGLTRRGFVAGTAAVAGALAMPAIGRAQTVQMRLHHFNSPLSIAHKAFLTPWAEKLKADSDGAIDIQIFPAMQLGGAPGDLYSQARDGIVDMVWTIPGYTANRFSVTEVFELPFLTNKAAATAPAVNEFAKTHFEKEYEDTHPLLFHTHAEGKLHTASKPVRTLEDLKGLRVRGPSQPITAALKQMGAVPVSMPLPEVVESISRGVVDGAVLPWSITRPIRLHEVTKYHTNAKFYALVFGLIMNKNKWASLPAELQKVFEDNTNTDFVKTLGTLWDEDEKPGLDLALKNGGEIIELDDAELARWKEASQPVIDAWITKVDGMGYDGKALIEESQALIAKYAAEA